MIILYTSAATDDHTRLCCGIQSKQKVTPFNITYFSIRWFEGKWKGNGNIDLYSTSSQTPLTRSDQDHTVLPANNAFTQSIAEMVPPRIYA